MIFLLLASVTQSDQTRRSTSKQIQTVFTNIYTTGGWYCGASYSGLGSDLCQTRIIRVEIPKLLERYNIKSMADAPCGDFYWMREVLLDVQYIGIDIVEEIIEKNKQLYCNDLRTFQSLDIVNDALPKVDLILCRDCLVHLSNEHVAKALRNIKKSGATYLLVTNFMNTRENVDIATGNWRPINLTEAPFNFPDPLEVINEGCTEGGRKAGDKALALWRLADVQI